MEKTIHADRDFPMEIGKAEVMKGCIVFTVKKVMEKS